MTQSSIRAKSKSYYRLAKPGIVYGNLITAVAGFLFGSKGSVDFITLVAMSAGVSFVIAGGCVLNNIIDVKIDKLMLRTKKRELVTNKIGLSSAYLYAFVLAIIGFLFLVRFTNMLTVLCGLVGFIFYVVAYSIAKRKTVYGTLVGTISGATPPVAGYLAATNHIDHAAVLLFLVLVFWQMPHFFAIAIRRVSDYSSASIPVLPVVKGLVRTKVHIIAYIVLFTTSTLLFSIYGYTGVMYTLVMTFVGLWWLTLSVRSLSEPSSKAWAKKVFLASLVNLLVFDVLIAFSNYLP